MIQSLKVYTREEFFKDQRFENISIPEVRLNESLAVHEIVLPEDNDELDKISHDNCLALTTLEMNTIRD